MNKFYTTVKKIMIGSGLLMVMLFFVNSNSIAQVTIGSTKPPMQGALLDLKEEGVANKGLILPRVDLKGLKKFQMGDNIINDVDNQYLKHTGLMVYNMTKNEASEATRACPGVHIWTGSEWKPIRPYPEWDNESELVGYRIIGYTLLDPTVPFFWPPGYLPADYPLGPVDPVPDNRPGNVDKSYPATRYYTARYDKQEYYYKRESFSCDPNNPNYIESQVGMDLVTTFDDGVWMAENLSATVMPDGTSITKFAGSGSLTVPQYAFPNNGASIIGQQGALYNFVAATNKGREGVTQDQGADGIEGPVIQGICPDGWILPSDRELTDLENGFIQNTFKFSTTANIGGELIDYTDSSIFRGVHGRAMKSTTAVNGKATGGTSRTVATGGFNMLMSGYVKATTSTTEYGDTGILRSNSVSSNQQSYTRMFSAPKAGESVNSATVIRFGMSKEDLYSVRCKRDIRGL